MPAKKHNFTVTEIKAGLMVLASIAVFALFLFAASGMRVKDEVVTYHVRFHNTLGLNQGADVRFGGAKIGKVVSIEFDSEDQSLIRITFEVEAGVPINADSVASVGAVSLTMQKHLEISTGSKNATLLAADSEIPVEEGDLMSAGTKLAETIQKVLDDVRDLFGVKEAKEKGEEIIRLTKILEDVDGTVNEGTDLVKDVRGIVSDARPDIEEILTKVKDIEDSAKNLVANINLVVSENREGIGVAVGKVSKILDGINDMTSQLDALAKTLAETLESAAGATDGAENFIDSQRSVIEDVILDVQEAVRYLKEFAATIAEQPESLVRGSEKRGRQ
jgi:phospholipid/cholesterol/gamma-HCH transport system substrate-binding protein